MNSLNDLAILGGEPAFSEQLFVNRPNLGERDVFLRHVENILETRWFTNDGPLVRELEERLAQFLEVEECVLTCNGTTAMGLALQALGLRGEVILPSFNFVSTAHALYSRGITPVFCDIDPITWNLSPEKCESLITERTSAIIGTHLWGQPCNIKSLEEIADRHHLCLLFDAAHAFGCSYQGQTIGHFGNAEVFSFHATKAFHTFEGGAITTQDHDLAALLRKVRNFGFSDYDYVDLPGTNAKMTEVCAAMGLANLESFDQLVSVNQKNYEVYRSELESMPGLTLFLYSSDERNNYNYIVLEVDEEVAGLTRDELVRILHAENVIARRYFYPGNHQMEPYRQLFPDVDSRLPITNHISQRVMHLPGGTGVSQKEIRIICKVLRLVIENAAELRTRLTTNSMPD